MDDLMEEYLQDEEDRWTETYASSKGTGRIIAAGRRCEIQDIRQKRKAMRAKVKPGPLPAAPKYAGGVGHKPGPEWDVQTDVSGHVMYVEHHAPKQSSIGVEPAEELKEKGSPVSDEELKEIHRLHGQGYTAKQIAAKIGRPYSAIVRKLRAEK